jgi:putative intracellular protease/amidase
MSRVLRAVVLCLLGIPLFVGTAGAIAATGVAVTMDDSFSGSSASPPPEGWPAPRSATLGAIVVAVVVGKTGSVVSDVLLPYEAFARSPRFFVYTVSERRAAAPLSGGVQLVPERTFADVDARAAPEPDVIVVPAVVDPVGSNEAALRGWLTRQAGRGAYILGVCAGVKVLAASGLLDGRRATSFWKNLGSLREDYPRVRWMAGQRYVEDGRIITTAGVTSGLVGALRVVELLAGSAEAETAGRALAYPGWSPGAPTTIVEQRLAISDLPYALNAAFPWFRPVVGVGLVDGVAESDVAAVFEVYAGTSFATRTVPIGPGRTVTTKHGVLLLTEPADDTAPTVDRLIVPGVERPDPALARWAAGRDLDVTVPHATRVAGEFPFDPVLRDLAGHADQATARTTAKFTEYPSGHLRLSGSAWPWRATMLCIATIIMAVLAATLPIAFARLLTSVRRQSRPMMSASCSDASGPDDQTKTSVDFDQVGKG